MISKVILAVLAGFAATHQTNPGQAPQAKATAPSAAHSAPAKREKSLAYTLTDRVIRPQERATFNARRIHAAAVERVMREAGATTDKQVIAALVNGWHECRWNPRDQTGHHRGFFQVGNFALPKGVSRDDLYNPRKNALTIVAHPRFREWLGWSNKHPGASASENAQKFSSMILRPAPGHSAQRGATAQHWYNGLQDQPVVRDAQ